MSNRSGSSLSTRLSPAAGMANSSISMSTSSLLKAGIFLDMENLNRCGGYALQYRQVKALAEAQGTSGGVICGGCGRVLEREFMELDHITPKSDRGANDILNRILLCRPCNGRKRDNLTLRGLMRENRAAAWMKDADRAKVAQSKATDKAEWVRDNYDTPECKDLIAGSLRR